MSNAIQTASPALVPLDEALEPYRGVSIRTARALVASGRLPATKIGRAYFVDPRDLAALFRPIARQPLPGQARRTPTQRADDALRDAGFAVPMGLSSAAGIDRR